jgi:hypothetical protein
MSETVMETWSSIRSLRYGIRSSEFVTAGLVPAIHVFLAVIG